jgi:hypothetical protein
MEEVVFVFHSWEIGWLQWEATEDYIRWSGMITSTPKREKEFLTLHGSHSCLRRRKERRRKRDRKKRERKQGAGRGERTEER